MKSVIVGTAGHIDHGKTSLVKALTGIDADRLAEEKRRGITIDIGFAHLDLTSSAGESLNISFVDVPGHERFVRNMLAGVSGIDFVLLVIAADEGVMPQTREHFDICKLLAVPRGLVVITKSDTVDRETLDVVRLEAEDFVRGSFLDSAQAPVVAVSALTGAGLDELKSTLARLAGEVSTRDEAAFPRLPIDRVFTMKGFGTVVTGTLISGTIHKEESLQVFPGERIVKVRGLQVHGAPIELAQAGQRTAINLAGAAVEDLSRGMVLTTPETFVATSNADVLLTLLPSAKPLKDRARVHVHAFTWETTAEVQLVGAKQIAPGESSLARLRFRDPTLLLPGDHFIIRQFSPVVTIGGGVVLDALPQMRMKKADREAFLNVLAEGDPVRKLEASVIRAGGRGLSSARAVAETGLRPGVIDQSLKNSEGRIVHLGDLWIAAQAFRVLQEATLVVLKAFHDKNTLVAGIGKDALRESLRVDGAVFPHMLDALIQQKRIEVTGELVRLPGRGIAMKNPEAEAKAAIEAAFASAGLKVPALKEVLGGLKIDRARAQQIVTLLLREKVLLKISEELVFHRTALETLRTLVAEEKKKSPRINVARFKDLTGVTRKYAIPLLEYLDRERVTRREGDERVIL